MREGLSISDDIKELAADIPNINSLSNISYTASKILASDCKTMSKSSPQEILRQYSININFFNLGCTISVGCNTIAFTTKEEALQALTDYFNDPIGTRDKFQSRM